jgi:outer membrane protein
MNRSILLTVFLLATFVASAQTLSLQQCIDSALARNLELRRSALAAETSEVQLQGARGARLPNLGADLYHGFNQGRGIDPTSNSYVNQSLNFGNYQLNSNVVLFNGGALRSAQQQQALAYEAARFEVTGTRDYLVISVITAYLQLLVNEDLLEAVTRQADLSRQQFERLRILDEQGAIRPSELSDIKGQWMNDQLAIVNAKQAMETARLALAQLMNRPYDPAMTIARLDTAAFKRSYELPLAQVLSESSGNFPGLRAATLRVQSSQYAIRAARGARMPTLTFGGGLATAYSSTAHDANGKTSYNTQLQNNLSTTVGMGLSVPIFNRLQGRTRVRLAEIDWKRSIVQEQQASLQLQQQVEGAWLTMIQARDRLTFLQEQVAAYTDSYAGAETRYKAGVGTSIDYLTAKDRLDRARINLIMARYDLELRKQVLDYFRGKP